MHQANVTLLWPFVAIPLTILLVFKFALPISPTWALVLASLLVAGLLAVAIVAAFHVSKIDSTESVLIRWAGLVVSAQNPSIMLVQQIVQTLRQSPRPVALIPNEVDPKDDPAKFHRLTDKQIEEVLIKEAQETLSKGLSDSESSRPDENMPATTETATIKPKVD